MLVFGSDRPYVNVALGAVIGYSLKCAIDSGFVKFFLGKLCKIVSFGSRKRTVSSSSDGSDSSMGSYSSSLIGEDHKMVIAVRTDLKMGKGKIAAQCCHGAVAAYKSVHKNDPDRLKAWEWGGQPKVVVKVPNETVLDEITKTAASLGVPAHAIRDAGRTQIAAGSKTVVAVGPAPIDLVDQVTGGLSLM
eukprot:Nk52_evm74s239 gene=Nk52_evmTU74s239